MSFNPTIIIPGIGQSKVDVVDAAGNKVKSAWPLDIDTKAILNDVKGALMKMMIFRKDGGFSDKVAGIVKDITDPLATNTDGTARNNVRPVSYPSVAECTADEKRYIYKMIPMEQLGEEIGEDNLYFYSFNPFGDLYEVAAGLDEYVTNVKKQHNCEKVNFICVSLGGAVLRAYIQKYAAKGDIDKIVNVVSALDGSHIVADIFEEKFNLDNPSELLKGMGGQAAQLSSMVGMLPGDVLTTTLQKALGAAKENLLLNCSMMWGIIPNDRFDAIYNTYLAGKGKDVLDKKVTEFHEYTNDFAEHAKECGIKFYMICGYDNTMMKALGCEKMSSDSIIHVNSASLGATAALAGEQLDADGEYVSPDKNVDASTCAFPDRTWLFRKQYHDDTAYNDVALSIIMKIIMGEIDDIHSSEKYPQFNNTRDIKRLKNKLIPGVKDTIANFKPLPDDVKAELEDCLKDYDEIIGNTIISGNEPVKALEKKIENAVEKLKN